MVATYRRGKSIREVACLFHVGKSTVQRWVKHAGDQRLARVDFNNQKSGVRKPQNKISPKLESHILSIRKRLKEKSTLGFFGADAIRDEMICRNDKIIPTSRTITNVLQRYGQIDRRKKIRRPPPPPGWYLPDLVQRKVELDSFDIVEKLYLYGGQEVQFFNGISLHGNLICSFPKDVINTENTIELLIQHWRQFGLPKYVQFDNDMVFQGTRTIGSVGRVIRLCLSLNVIPVFATPYEQGFQGKIERFNGELQTYFWRRKIFKNINQVNRKLSEWILAHRMAHQEQIITAPLRRPFPRQWQRNDNTPLQGQCMYLRRTNGDGITRLLEHNFFVHTHWVNRLVRAEVDIDRDLVTFYGLRRQDPTKQDILNTVKFTLIKNKKT